MNRPSRVIRLVAVLGMLVSMLAVLSPAAVADENPGGGLVAMWDKDTWPSLFAAFESDMAPMACISDIGSGDDVIVASEAECDGIQEIYFAAVSNGEDFGLGAAQTSVSVQNIDVDDAYVFFFVGSADGGWNTSEYAYLSAGASKTFTAAELGIAEGETVPVVAALYKYLAGPECADLAGGGVICDTPFGGVILAEAPPALGIGAVGAGVAKQAVAGASLPYTTAADTSVSGYNAVSGREVGFFDQLYFPIVQHNAGPGGVWNSILRVANVGEDENAAVTVRFFPADDGSGSLQTGFQLQALIDPGEQWSIDIAEWVPEGWVGSAHVFTDDAVVAIVDRYKAGTDMWITNSASNAASESFWQFPGGPSSAPYVLFAPDVRTDWNGWNTGISVANTVDTENHVWIQYFGSNGNAPLALDRRLEEHGMTYFYNPSAPSEDECEQPATDVPGCEYIGGAIILSQWPVATAVDGVKYFGNDANVGQAFSYSATGNAYTDLYMPLVQKGNPATGMGATSGINFLNPNAQATIVETAWINPSGFNASNYGNSIVWVPGYATGFVYTMFHSNLPNGFYGSAVVDSELPVVATSANVDYQVQGDGTAVWNLYNPCGFFRFAGECVFTAPVDPTPSPVSATITKVVTCDDCDLDFDGVAEGGFVEGAIVTFEGTDEAGFAVSGSGITGADGEVVFAVPAGDYTVTITAVPAGYVNDAVADDVTVVAGDAITIVNDITQAPLEGEGVITKGLDLGDALGAGVLAGTYSLNSVVYICEGVVEMGECDALTDEAVVAHGGFDDFGGGFTFEFSADVPAGQYTICSAADVTGDFDGDGTDETVGYNFRCESEGIHSVNEIGAVPVFDNDGPFFVFDGLETFVMNDFEAALEGALDVYVRDDVTNDPIEGATVTLFDEDGNVVATGTTGADGLVSFAVGTGTYTSNASHPAYESESATIDYSVIDDLFSGPLADDATTADLVQSLDPAAATLGVLTTINAIAVPNTPVSLFEASQFDSFGEPGFCSGAFVGFQVTDATGLAEFGVEVGDYCVSTDVDNDGDIEATAATAEAGDPAGDVDVTVDVSAEAALDIRVDDQAVFGENFVEIFVADFGDVTGVGGSCAGAFVASGTTTNDYITFGVLAGNYCVVAQAADFFPNAQDVQQVSIAFGDPAGDLDAILLPQ